MKTSKLFSKVATPVCIPTSNVRGEYFPHPYQHIIFSVFFIITIPVGMRWHLIVVLITNSFLTKVQRQFNGERRVFSRNDVGTIEYPYAKRPNLELNFTPDTKINLKWITELNVFDCKHFRRKHRKSSGTEERQRFLKYDTKHMIHKRKSDELDFQIKNFGSGKTVQT